MAQESTPPQRDWGEGVKVIKAKKIPRGSGSKDKGSDVMQLLATFCYYFPAYTLAEARKLPHRHVVLMLKQAKRLESARYYTLLQIAKAPHTKKGVGFKNLEEQFLRESR